MLGPTKGGADHHHTRGPYEVIDFALSDAVVAMATNTAVMDCLTL